MWIREDPLFYADRCGSVLNADPFLNVVQFLNVVLFCLRLRVLRRRNAFALGTRRPDDAKTLASAKL